MKPKKKQCTITTCSTEIFCLVMLLIGQRARAENWTTYMHDNSRSGVTAEELDLSNLNQAWVYTPPPPPRTAWSGPSVLTTPGSSSHV